jgi:hypothetical protein
LGDFPRQNPRRPRRRQKVYRGKTQINANASGAGDLLNWHAGFEDFLGEGIVQVGRVDHVGFDAKIGFSAVSH